MKGTYVFTLKNVDINELLTHFTQNDDVFDHKLDDGLYVGDEDYSLDVTQIIHADSHRYFTYLDYRQKRIKVWVTNYDSSSGTPLPMRTNQPCWWDREEFDSAPIGLPIHYHPHACGSEGDERKTFLEQLNLPCENNFYFETDGNFCSFNCAKAYALDRQRDEIKYRESGTLLTLMYEKFFGEIVNIQEAGSWKTLKKWNGHLTVKEFRSSFNVLLYSLLPNIKRPLMYGISNLIEEKEISS